MTALEGRVRPGASVVGVVICYIVGGLLMLLLLAGFALTLLPREANLDGTVDSRELPLSELCGEAWSRDSDVVLLALCPYGRIQAYRVDGTFAYGFNVPTSGGALSLVEVADGVLRVDIERGDRSERVDSRGRRSVRDTTSISPKSLGAAAQLVRPKIVASRALFRTTVKVERAGEFASISTSTLGTLLQVPFPAGILGIAGVMLLRLAARLRARAN